MSATKRNEGATVALWGATKILVALAILAGPFPAKRNENATAANPQKP